MSGREIRNETTPASTALQPALEWDRNLEGVLESWRRRAWASQIAHYQVASRLRLGHRTLGLPVVILTTAVGTSIFATLSHEKVTVGLWPRVIVATITVGAAVLAGVQTFFGFAQRADQHVLAADWYSAIRRKIEQVQGTPKEWRGDARECLDSVRKEMNQVGSQFPEIGQKTWEQVAIKFGVEEPPPVSSGDQAGRRKRS
jgi:hypothetical protein